MLVTFASQSRPGSPDYSGERLVNYFARQSGQRFICVSRGGLSEVVNLGGAVRAQVQMGGNHYAVANGTVWKISGSVASNVGAVSDGKTGIAATASEVAIVAGGKYYICDGSTTTSYTPGALESATDVAMMDGYFVVIGESGGRSDAIQISSLDDGTTFNALEYAFAEEDPDGLVGILRDHDLLWLFGTRTVQTYYNSGSSDFPFSPVAGALIEHGCVPWTISKADNTVFWVNPNGTVMRSGGGAPSIISTPEVSAKLTSVTGAFSFSEDGHQFYAVVQSVGPSLVFDMVTGLWHERASGIGYAPWAATGAYEINGTTYFGCNSGQIATSSKGVFTDFGGVLLGEAISEMMQTGGNRFRISKLHVNTGGGSIDIGRTPKIVAQTSPNGRTWSLEKERDLPDLGEYYRRVTWHRLGQFRRANVRIRITDPVPRDIIGAEVSIV